MSDILVRIENRIHDSHMDIERLLDECGDEIERLRSEITALRSQAESEDWKSLYEETERDNKSLHAALVDAARRSQAVSALQVHPSELIGEIGRLQEENAALRSPPMTVQLSPPTEDEQKHLDGLQKTSHSPPMRNIEQEALWVCAGCGTRKSLEQIKGEHPQALSCCPERRMMPVSREEYPESLSPQERQP